MPINCGPSEIPWSLLSPTRPSPSPHPRRRLPQSNRARTRRRRFMVLVVVALLAALAVGGLLAGSRGPGVSPLRTRIVAIAQGQVGYRTDPSDSYCNRFSAYWHAGTDDCGNDNRSEEWCADFAAWVWKQAGAEVAYELGPPFL